MQFYFFAQPWWVNLLILVPVLAYLGWRRWGLDLGRQQLIYSAIFGVAFGFVEAAGVVYLRGAVGLLPGYGGTLDEVRRLSSSIYHQAEAVGQLPESLLKIEVFREAATLFVLVSVALLAAAARRERFALFLWVFAIWDICYYAGLWVTVRWPPSLATPDVLFLIPEPWLAQVWFPITISVLTVVAVIFGRRAPTRLS
ncbi:MAG TPA: hypothetical protein VGQ71_04605 [Terriglobales bacterium]|jgi:hypothetical protein|nr:hypothetical protein [Terriglobales bacterium]